MFLSLTQVDTLSVSSTKIAVSLTGTVPATDPALGATTQPRSLLFTFDVPLAPAAPSIEGTRTVPLELLQLDSTQLWNYSVAPLRIIPYHGAK